MGILKKVMPNKASRVPQARLHIKGFSCVKELTVCFSLMTILIGEQASGKSVTCKLYYFFTKVLRNAIENSVREDLDFDGFKRNIEKVFRAIFPETAWMNDTFRIEWETDSWLIVIKHKSKNKRLTFEWGKAEETYQEILDQVRSKRESSPIRQNDFDKFAVNDYELSFRFNHWLNELLDEKTVDSAVNYIPAGRSFFSTIQDNVFTLLTENIGLDYFLKAFGQTLEGVRFHYRHRGVMLEKELRDSVLHGQYEDTGKDQWIVRDGTHRVRLADSSSGQQEALPLLLVLSFLLTSSASGVALIEEPEAHLYPTAQCAIINYIGRAMAKAKGDRGFVLTTHSPFILCCLNNLIIQKKLAVSDVAAYHLHDGTADNIINKDVGLIDAVRFDEVSTQIANGE